MSRVIELRQSPTPMAAEDGETVLEASLRGGVDYPHSCRAGRCGACKSRLLAGEVELLPHSRFALSEDERTQGLILACRAVPKTDVTISWGTEGDPVAAIRSLATVVAKHLIAPRIVRLVVRPHVGPITFRPGQYMRLTFRGALARNYSPASQPGEELVEFHIRLLDNGLASRVLACQVEVGDAVEMSGPFGDAYLREGTSGPLLAIAASSGLAPIKSIVDRALRIDPGRSVRVYVSARTRDDLYLHDYFERLSARYPEVSFRPLLTGVTSSGPRRLPQVLPVELETTSGFQVHLAGPPSFVEAVSKAAEALGGHPADIHADPFTTDLPRAGRLATA